MTRNRYNNALAIMGGACNPTAIVGSIKEALAEVRVEKSYRGTDSLTSDPAVRLMVHQLAFICGVGDGAMCDNFTQALDACHKLKVPEDDGTT